MKILIDKDGVYLKTIDGTIEETNLHYLEKDKKGQVTGYQKGIYRIEEVPAVTGEPHKVKFEKGVLVPIKDDNKEKISNLLTDIQTKLKELEQLLK